ncbi:MAG TPA: NADH-quinone oxidoreductase subunit C [Kineosporiaceae bacterium]|nr:NADH-quinone oxidoreductase subunit C [Kineosporiaceae bacterium]
MNPTTVDVPELLAPLGEPADVLRNAGGWWAVRPRLDVRAMAGLMRDHEVRLVTISARPAPDGGHILIYHWNVGSAVLNICTVIPEGGQAVTIADLLPAADWAEREIRDYYGLEFTGRTRTPTLMLREGDPAGLFSRTADVGRETDPAATARRAAEAEEGEAK